MTLHERIIQSFESETSRHKFIEGLRKILDGAEKSGEGIKEMTAKMATFSENHMRGIVTKETMDMINDRLFRRDDKVDGRLPN